MILPQRALDQNQSLFWFWFAVDWVADSFVEPTQAWVRPVNVLIGPPGFNNPLCGWLFDKDVLGEAFVAQLADQALRKRVLHRLVRRDVAPASAAILLPAQHACDVNAAPLSLTTSKGAPDSGVRPWGWTLLAIGIGHPCRASGGWKP